MERQQPSVRCGLAGDTYKAFELAPKLLHGAVNVNSPTFNDQIHAPIGGVRESGWGDDCCGHE